jgi:signal transduction histidine kinase
MEFRRSAGKYLPIAAVVATLALFAVIAALQSRWISQLSEAELQRAKIRLDVSVRAVQTDVNRELSRAYILFQWEAGTPRASLAQLTSQAYATWGQTAQFPDLIRRVLLVQPAAGAGELQMAVYNTALQQYQPIAWPTDLRNLREQLALPFHDYDTFGVRTFTGVTLADAPLLVFPLDQTFHNGLPGSYGAASGWLLVELNQQLLLTRIIPQSIHENLAQSDRFDYQIVKDGFPNRIIYRSNPKLALSGVDATSSLLETRREYLRSDKGGSGRAADFPFGRTAQEQLAIDRLHRWHYVRVNLPGVPPALPSEAGVWQLQVRHRAGSLEAAAAKMRRGNLLLGFAMLALVAASLAILGLSARRAHRLAEARLQFAAGVSHELRTPLAAICSAADNLAAGVACEPGKVRQYGAAILDQGRQLTDMVEQILAFTGGQIGKKYYEVEALSPADVVRQAISTVASAARQAGVTIEERIPEDLPSVLGDSQALRQALVNLLNNAIRYAAGGGWIGVSIRKENADELEVRVADKGAGISARELKRIFEPFYRGTTSANPQRRGSGLGLTIVEQTARAHGGRVSVESEPGHGSCFILHLPAYSYAATSSHSRR